MRRTLAACLLLAFCVGAAFGQKTKWTDWSKKDVDKMLNDSPWGQTQTEGAKSQSSSSESSSAITQVAAPRAANRQMDRQGESGEAKPSTLVKYHVRFLSAKPIRQAFARMVLLSQQSPNDGLAEQLQGFVDRDFGDYIVVAITAEADDKRAAGMITQVFGAATAESLKSAAYLERKDGKRLSLMDYRAPANDGMGAKFVFPRTLDGEPFLKADSDNVRFVFELNKNLKLNMRYKLSDMTYDCKLEY